MIEAGMQYTVEKVVTKEMTAAAVGGKDAVMALGTPFLVAMFEDAAVELMKPHLEPGQGSVGTKIVIKHLAPTPVGMKVRVTATVTEVDRKRLEFSIEAFDEVEKIGEGTEQRFIISQDKFRQGVEMKAAKAAQ